MSTLDLGSSEKMTFELSETVTTQHLMPLHMCLGAINKPWRNIISTRICQDYFRCSSFGSSIARLLQRSESPLVHTALNTGSCRVLSSCRLLPKLLQQKSSWHSWVEVMSHHGQLTRVLPNVGVPNKPAGIFADGYEVKS